ncbi:MAG TPA: serine hydrolase [Chitinophagaceae bacterium]|nr:serine hydrolase [Chitinophagaceae bacterium]
MKKIILLITFFFLTAGIKAQPFNPLLANMLRDTLNTYVSQIGNIKGMSASVYIPGQGIWNGVSGLSYAGNPVTADMRMGIASNSKLFVAVIMLKLAENNILSLNDSIKRWLPNYPNINPNITIRQLLNHTSGISDPLFLSPWMDTIKANPTRVFTPHEVLGWVGPPLFPAGTSWGYSNINYIVAGMIAKNATGFSIARLIRDSILTPLNMNSTFYDVEEPANGTIAHRWWNSVDYHDTSRVGLNTAGGCAGALFSTSAEMVQWYTALFNGQIINPSSINQLTTFVGTGNAAYQYGLGFSRENTQNYVYWGHGGSTWGYRSKMIYDSCLKVSVSGLTNSFPSGMEAVTFLLYRVVKNHIPGCSGPVSGTGNLCQGTNNITYTVPPIPGATSYTWTLPAGVSGTSNTNSITVNVGATAASGNITVSGVNSFGPGGSSSLFITVKPTPAAPVITQNGNTLSSSAPSGNQWYNANGIINGATGSTYAVAVSGSYYCIVTLAGCSSTPSNTINAVVTGVTNTGNGSSWKIFPNPVAGYFFSEIKGMSVINTTLNIYNLAGTLIKTERITRQQQRIDVSLLAGGVYMVELQSGLLRVRQKLLVIR